MTRYDLMKPSVTEDGEGGFYPDPLSLPLNKFQVSKSVLEYNIKEKDIVRPDILFYRAYGSVDHYELVFLLNNIGYIDEIEVDTTLLLPDRSDIEEFILDNQV